MAHVYTSTLWAHLRALELSSSDIEKCESQLPASAKHQVMTGHGPLEPSCPQNGAPSHIVNLQGVQLVQKNPEKIGRCHHIIVAISAQIPKPRAKQPKKKLICKQKKVGMKRLSLSFRWARSLQLHTIAQIGVTGRALPRMASFLAVENQLIPDVLTFICRSTNTERTGIDQVCAASAQWKSKWR